MDLQPQEGPRLSRYRSVRKQAAEAVLSSPQAECAPPISTVSPNAAAIQRSRSRYRKAGPASEPVSSMPALPPNTSFRTQSNVQAQVEADSPSSTLPRRYHRDQPGQQDASDMSKAHAPNRPFHISPVLDVTSKHHRDISLQQLEGGPLKQPTKTPGTKEPNLTSGRTRAGSDLPTSAAVSNQEREQIEIARRMREKQRELEAQAASQKSQELAKERQHQQDLRSRPAPGESAIVARPRAASGTRHPPLMLNTGPSNVPGVDAPVSAVNAGERVSIAQSSPLDIISVDKLTQESSESLWSANQSQFIFLCRHLQHHKIWFAPPRPVSLYPSILVLLF